MAAPSESPAGTEGKRPLWERFRQGRLATWWRALLRDYAEACREAAAEARRRPGRALLYAGLTAGLVGCALNCPGEASLEAELLEAADRLLLLSPPTRSPAAEAHVGRLLALRAEGRLRVQSLGLLAVASEAPFPADAALYRARCPHLAPAWLALPSRLLDVGWAGRWWLLRRSMRDCDVNAEEFAALPAHLRRLDFHHLHSARNERLFLQKFQPAPPLSPQDLGPEEHAEPEKERQTLRSHSPPDTPTQEAPKD